ncbi:DUF4280 domain-containing protein [Paenibacillus hexagrammi]|uniref:DUF4280 domain-containing protein n=1 Tax=Paenibacillus hexagrammi TaxID=2908839 RepID=A0ABY3SDY9_9BACL|nr:DUF4280 domain-containing protein [Paenibacillus sp. YPD9-1]UJF32209.1 DUF4280 domain-containing protein [Paenibacillus sp. YPD9-1]
MNIIRGPIEVKRSGGQTQQTFVVAGAVVSCSCGNMRTRLTMPLSHGVSIKGKPQLTVEDYKPYQNIMPFGMCCTIQNPEVNAATTANENVLRPMPCKPVIQMPWTHGKQDKLIEGKPALLSPSTTTCQYNGIISIEDDGQEM